MKKLLVMTLAAGTMLSTAALSTAAQAAPERIRGTVTAVDAKSVTVHTASSDVKIALNDQTKYLKVVKSSLDHVDKDSYIGTATKEVGGKLIALEVVVFPAAMKGAGEGHYGWDRIPDTTVGGSSPTSSSMTNGTVSAVQTGATVNSSMTNGTVASASSGGGAKQITVDYKGGKQNITVPPTAPIVTFEPNTMADVATGKTVFVVATDDNGTKTAGAVIVGTPGAPPPM